MFAPSIHFCLRLILDLVSMAWPALRHTWHAESDVPTYSRSVAPIVSQPVEGSDVRRWRGCLWGTSQRPGRGISKEHVQPQVRNGSGKRADACGDIEGAIRGFEQGGRGGAEAPSNVSRWRAAYLGFLL